MHLPLWRFDKVCTCEDLCTCVLLYALVKESVRFALPYTIMRKRSQGLGLDASALRPPDVDIINCLHGMGLPGVGAYTASL
jgi:hypothetical protein